MIEGRKAPSEHRENGGYQPAFFNIVALDLLEFSLQNKPQKKQKIRLKTVISNTFVSYSLSSICKTAFQKVLNRTSKGRQLESKRASFASQLGVFQKPKEHVLVLWRTKIVYKHQRYKNKLFVENRQTSYQIAFYLLAYLPLQDHLIWDSNTLHTDKSFFDSHSIHLTTQPYFSPLTT